MAIGQHTCCNKQKVKRGLWSPEEDEKLISCIITYGHGSWSNVPKLAGLQRCGKSCRLRWINYLRPDLRRGSFSPQEASLIIELHKILGNRWAQIAKHLPGRTDNEVKNFWNSSIKKKLISQGGDRDYAPDHQHIIPYTFVYPNPNHHQANFYNFNNNANPNIIIPPAAPHAPHHEQADHEIIQHNQQQLPLYVPYELAPMAPLQGFNQNADGALQNDHHEQMRMMMMNNDSDFDGMQIKNPPAAVPQPAGLRVGVPVSAAVPTPAVPVLPAVINSSSAVQDHDQQQATWTMSSSAQFHQNLFNTLKQEFFDNSSAGMFMTTMVPPPAAASAMPNLAHQTIARPAMTLQEMDDMDDFSHFSPQEVSDHDPIGNGLSSPDDDLPSDDQANFSHDLHVPSDHMDYIDALMSSFPSTSSSSSSSPSSASSSLSPLSYSQFDVNDTLASSWD